MKITSSFQQSKKVHDLLVSLSKNWFSMERLDGIDICKIQAFSQHHFFSLLDQGIDIADSWSQYPQESDSKKSFFYKILARTIFFTKTNLSPTLEIANIPHKTDVILFASGRHLTELLNLAELLAKRFKVIVIGKISNADQEKLSKLQISYFDLTQARRYLKITERFKILLFFLANLRVSKSFRYSKNPFWKSRLLYLKLFLFPEIFSLIKIVGFVLKASKPKLILMVGSNDTLGSTFSSVAKKLGIKVAEIQHGYRTIDLCGPFYTCDYQLVWSEMVKKINMSNLKNFVVVGSPQLQKLKNFVRKKRGPAKINILVLWAPSFGVSGLFKSKSNKETLLNLITGLSGLPKNFNITLRSHPSYDLSSDLAGIDLNKNFVIDNHGDTASILKKHDIVLTQPTTAGYMATIYQKPLLFFNNSKITEKYKDPLVASGSALEIPYDRLTHLSGYVIKFINDKDYLKKQQNAQKKFAGDYCSFFGDESSKKIVEFANNIINGKI